MQTANAVNEAGETPLRLAVIRKEFMPTVERLLMAGANPNGPDGADMTPLQAACAYGSPAVIECLLRAGAGADESYVETALFWGPNSVEKVHLLLEYGCDFPPIQPDSRNTYIMRYISLRAEVEGGSKISENLLQQGDDYWPLHCFTARDEPKVVYALIDSGIDLGVIRNLDGKTAWEIADDHSHLSLADYLATHAKRQLHEELDNDENEVDFERVQRLLDAGVAAKASDGAALVDAAKIKNYSELRKLLAIETSAPRPPGGA